MKAENQRINKCKDCQFYTKEYGSHGGRCSKACEKFKGANDWVGCNREACERFQKR